MVATDVASRGIGMIDHSTAPSSLSPFVSCGASCRSSLSAFVFSASTTLWSKHVITFGFLSKKSMDISCVEAC